MPDAKETDWAYAAGFVDGEGCIAISRCFVPNRDRFVYGVQVVVSNREIAVLEWMRSCWGGWVVSNSPSARGTKAREARNWRAPTGIGSVPFLTGIRPYLRIKADQCDNALVMAELMRRSRRTLDRNLLPKEWLEEQEALYWKQRELNHRGTEVFVRKPMHSPRKIARSRLSTA